MTKEFLTVQSLRLQERVLPFKNQLMTETEELYEGLSTFYDVVKQVVVEPVIIAGRKIVLPDIDVVCNYAQEDKTPHFTLSLEAHGGVTRWGYDVSVRQLCMKEGYGQYLYTALSSYLANMSLCLIADYNASVLTELVGELITDNDIAFYVGDGIDLVKDNAISLGIANTVLLNISDILKSISRVEDSIHETFDSLPCILDCKKRRTEFANKLGLYTMKSPKSMLKKAYRRRIETVRNSIGIYEKDGMTALVECTACDNKMLNELRREYGANCHVIENSKPRTGDFVKVRSQQELERIKARLARKGIEYKIIPCGDTSYKVLIKQYLCYHCVFGPINLDTYTTDGSVSSTSDLFNY